MLFDDGNFSRGWSVSLEERFGKFSMELMPVLTIFSSGKWQQKDGGAWRLRPIGVWCIACSLCTALCGIAMFAAKYMADFLYE